MVFEDSDDYSIASGGLVIGIEKHHTSGIAMKPSQGAAYFEGGRSAPKASPKLKIADINKPMAVTMPADK